MVFPRASLYCYCLKIKCQTTIYRRKLKSPFFVSNCVNTLFNEWHYTPLSAIIIHHMLCVFVCMCPCVCACTKRHCGLVRKSSTARLPSVPRGSLYLSNDVFCGARGDSNLAVLSYNKTKMVFPLKTLKITGDKNCTRSSNNMV